MRMKSCAFFVGLRRVYAGKILLILNIHNVVIKCISYYKRNLFKNFIILYNF